MNKKEINYQIRRIIALIIARVGKLLTGRIPEIPGLTVTVEHYIFRKLCAAAEIKVHNSQILDKLYAEFDKGNRTPELMEIYETAYKKYSKAVSLMSKYHEASEICRKDTSKVVMKGMRVYVNEVLM